ncbi:MAG: hypothetical protein BroJett003_00200 [Planctomycetota bacterium]|nr:MAG: hypothetical protein BroJett003_00200 [Planctomycetota bacterium]
MRRQDGIIAVLILAGGAAGVSADTIVRVATWNLETIGVRGSSEYNAALAILGRICPDVVAIQEIEGDELDDFADLAEDAGFAYTIVPTSNPFGSLRNGFLSRHPFMRTTINTSANLSGDSNANDITRLIVEVVLDVPGAAPLTLVTEHWKSGTADADEFRRAVESLRAAQAVGDLDTDVDAFVILGDMNEEIDSVPRSPDPFTQVPGGMPTNWRLGNDLRTILNAQGIRNDPFIYLTSASGPEVTALEARQKDGRDATRDSSGRRLDYILVSALLSGYDPPSEVYDSRDEGLGGGLAKCGSALSSGTSAAAADHFIVFTDLTLPASGAEFGDADRDGDVDLRDIAAFMNCFTGAGGDADSGCGVFDNNGDNDVDLPDYRVFRGNITGP